MKTLNLTLRKKWFDMIASGEKKEEYREVKKYWFDRLVFKKEMVIKYLQLDTESVEYFNHQLNSIAKSSHKNMIGFNPFDAITFRNGYGKNSPTMIVECLGIDIGEAAPEWSDNWGGQVFRIKLGKIIK